MSMATDVAEFVGPSGQEKWARDLSEKWADELSETLIGIIRKVDDRMLSSVRDAFEKMRIKEQKGYRYKSYQYVSDLLNRGMGQ